MPLGQYFPADFARTQLERQLQPGMVVKFVAKMDDQAFHEKRFVILHVSDETFTCVINSEISRFIAEREHMAICQVPIDQASHSFMSWDSHIDCSRVRKYTKAEILGQLQKNPDWVMGMTSTAVLSQMAEAIGRSKLVSKGMAAQCCAAIQKILEEQGTVSQAPAEVGL